MNKLDKDYQALLQDILDNGHQKGDRTGTGTISVFGRQIRHNMKDGFPLITTKKMYWKGIVTELLWFLRGDTNIKFLVDNDCHIWNGDAYQAYLKKWKPQPVVENELHWMEQELVNDRPLPKDMFIHCIKNDDEFAKKWGELGPAYGHQWRSWGEIEHDFYGIDQIANLIHDLKTNPDSRRLMVSAWNVGELDQMTLPPCHYGFQVYTRELSADERMQLWQNQQAGRGEFVMECLDVIPRRAISLMWNQRSVDTFLGLPFNIASYGLLLEIIAKEVNMVPEELIGNLGDTHLYLNHIEQAKEQIGREMTWEEQVQWVMKNTDVEMENLYITEEVFKDTTPKHTREPYPLPKLVINDEFWLDGRIFEQIEHIKIEDFDIREYQSHAVIKAPLSN